MSLETALLSLASYFVDWQEKKQTFFILLSMSFSGYFFSKAMISFGSNYLESTFHENKSY